MRNGLRLVKLSELDFLCCFKNGIYGREGDYIKSWKVGETLVFVVDDFIAGMASVSGICYRDEEPLWEKNLYPFRIPLMFSKSFVKGKRPSFDKHKAELKDFFGDSWGYVFVNRRPVPDEISFSIMQNVRSHKSSANELSSGIDLKVARELNDESRRMIDQAKKMVSKKNGDEDNAVDTKVESLALRLIEYCHNDPDTFVNNLRYESFVRTLSEQDALDLQDVEWSELKMMAGDCMRKQGLFRPLWTQYGPGTYIVVGDSHGEYTKTGMWSLVRNMSKVTNADMVFHIGHLIDDNGLINREMSDLVPDLVVVTRIEESHDIETYVRSFEEEPFDIVRDGVMLGTISVGNQDTSNDYMIPRPASRTMRKGSFKETSILNHHCFEFDVADSDDDDSGKLFAYPGCLCEPHVDDRKKKKIKFKEGILDEVHLLGGYHSRYHRRRFALKNEWHQGLFVVHINSDMSHTIVPCAIKKVFINGKEEYVTSYFDTMISEDSVYDPEEKFMVVTDIHAPLHDPEVLDVQEQIAHDYHPDVLVNLGDMRNGEGMNHHKWEKQEVVTETIIDEAVSVHGILARMAKWSPERYIVLGNHERFACDMVNKFPQFKGLIEFEFMCSPKSLGYHVVGLQEKLQFDNLVFIHGDIYRGAAAILFDRYSEAFPGKTVVMGHLHFPAIRNNCYMIGYSGQRDQSYNSKTISKWCHGVGLVNRFCGEVWVTTLAIENGSIRLFDKRYSARETDSWRNFNCKAELRFVTEDQEQSDGLDSKSGFGEKSARRK